MVQCLDLGKGKRFSSSAKPTDRLYGYTAWCSIPPGFSTGGKTAGARSKSFTSFYIYIYVCVKKKVKWSRYRPGVAQRVGRGTALLFHDRGTRRGWVVSSTPRPHFTPRKDPVPILQEAEWASGRVCTGEKTRLHRNSIPDRPARSQSLYRLSYPAYI